MNHRPVSRYAPPPPPPQSGRGGGTGQLLSHQMGCMLKGKKANEGPRNVCSDFAVAAYAIPYARSAACSIWIILSNKNIHGPPRHSTSTPGPLVCHTHLPWASQQSLSARQPHHHVRQCTVVPKRRRCECKRPDERAKEKRERGSERKKKKRERDGQRDGQRERGRGRRRRRNA